MHLVSEQSESAIIAEVASIEIAKYHCFIDSARSAHGEECIYY